MISLNQDLFEEEFNRLSYCTEGDTFEHEVEILSFRSRSCQNQAVWLAGPWLGEFGVALIRWIPYLRWLKHSNPQIYLIAGGYKEYHCLYSDFVDEYWVLPSDYKDVFLNQETPYNYGTLHGLLGNTSYYDYCKRKNINSHDEDHYKIALSWLKKIKDQRILVDKFLIYLNNKGRIFYSYRPSFSALNEAFKVLNQKKINLELNKIVCFLPRMRKWQPERSWSISFYKSFISKVLKELPHVGIIILGSCEHEGDLQGFSEGYDRVVNAMLGNASLDLQIAFWNLADVATGPLSGGLVMGYVIGKPLIHWYKPNQFPKRKGIAWNEEAEKDYTSIKGILSSWVEVSDSDSSASSVMRLIQHIDQLT